jgi:glycosyltransferase involved in cell wall biosynthesis
MPRVSIIVPTYNGGKLIERALKSISSQTFQDFEVIVVDDASTDSTKEKVQSFVRRDPRFQLIILTQNSGGGAVPRTTGCKLAQGEFVAFLDQDDLYLPEYLERKVAYFDAHPEINFLSSLTWTFDEDDKNKSIINCEYGGPLNTMVRREVLERTGYFKASQTNADDMGMWYRYLKVYGAKMNTTVSDEPLTLYARHIGQESHTSNRDPHIFINRIDSVLGEIREDDNDPHIKNLLSYLYSRKANFYCLGENLEAGRYFFKKSLSYKFNYFSAYLLILSYLGYGFYRKIEFFSRLIQRKFFWKLKTEICKFKYKQSYKKAIEILS